MQELIALNGLKDANKKISKLENANQYYEQIIAISDTINKYSRLKELDLLELKYKYQETQKQQKLELDLIEAHHDRKELSYVFTYSFFWVSRISSSFSLCYPTK